MSQPVMNGAIEHELVQKIMNYQLAIAQGEIESAKSVLHEDVVYIVPGSNIFSGTYKGPEEVVNYFGRLMGATDGSYSITEMNWLVCDNKVILETVNVATRNGHRLEWDEAILFEFRDGRKSKIEMFQADQIEVDTFFNT
jgi:uncharacterized protein